MHQDPVVGVPEEVVILKQVGIPRSEVGRHHHGHLPEPLLEGVLATWGGRELRRRVNLPLHLLLVPNAEVEVPHVIKDDAVAVSKACPGRLRGCFYRIEANFRACLITIDATSGPGRMNLSKTDRPAIFLISVTKVSFNLPFQEHIGAE